MAKHASLSSLFNLQSKSINFIFGHLRQNTKVIDLLFGQNASFSSLFNLQSKSINFDFGHVSAKYQGCSLSGWPKMPHCHHLSICIQIQSTSILISCRQNTKVIALLLARNASFSSLFNLQSKSINVKFGQLSAKYQGYSLTFWPEMAHFHHFSICIQHQSMSILIISRLNTKVIASLVGQKCLIVITFQSAIKINQFQFW